MVKGWLDMLRGRGILPAGRRDVLVLLNHNPANAHEPGDVSLFGSTAALEGDVMADDVRTGHYLAVDTAGRLITMTPASGHVQSSIVATTSPHATHAQLAMRLLKQALFQLIEDNAVSLSRNDVERAQSGRDLVALVPANVVFGYVDGVPFVRK